MQPSQYNKTTAATLAGAAATVIVAIWPGIGGETIAAIQMIVTAVLVWAIPNGVKA